MASSCRLDYKVPLPGFRFARLALPELLSVICERDLRELVEPQAFIILSTYYLVSNVERHSLLPFHARVPRYDCLPFDWPH